MDTSFIAIIFVVAIAVIIIPRLMPPRGPICNRCGGNGDIDEKWPDPSEEGGWHIATGVCPKCSGKGRLRS